MYDAFVAYGLQYLLHKRRMKFYRKMYAAALLCEFLQHVGRILNAYFPKGKLAEIFLTAVQCGMPHREGVRRLLYPDVVSVKQMCIMLGGISMKTAYKLLGNGEIHHLKIGKSFKIPKICVIEYLLG